MVKVRHHSLGLLQVLDGPHPFGDAPESVREPPGKEGEADGGQVVEVEEEEGEGEGGGEEEEGQGVVEPPQGEDGEEEEGEEEKVEGGKPPGLPPGVAGHAVCSEEGEEVGEEGKPHEHPHLPPPRRGAEDQKGGRQGGKEAKPHGEARERAGFNGAVGQPELQRTHGLHPTRRGMREACKWASL